MTISEIIDDITDILQLFIPGFCGLSVFCYLTHTQLKSETKVILSCVLSYVAISLLKLIPYVNTNFATLPLSGLAITILVLLSWLWAIIVRSEKFQNFLLRQSHGTIHTDYWQDALDFENGMNVKIYPKDKFYYVIGNINLLSEYESEERWISLSNFGKYSLEHNDPLENEIYLEGNDDCYHIRLADVDHIETFVKDHKP